VQPTDEERQAVFLHCLGSAKMMLEQSGEFYPFGAFVDAEGQVVPVEVEAESENPGLAELVGALVGALQKALQEERAKLTALAANVTLRGNPNIPANYAPPADDGIGVTLTTTADMVRVYVPYRIERQGVPGKTRKVAFGQPLTVRAPDEG